MQFRTDGPILFDVIPAQAGIQIDLAVDTKSNMDSRFRGNDGI